MARSKDPTREYDRNGRVKPLEGPTPETALKHQERAQRFHIPAHMEAGYAESTMGVLYARGMISVEQYELCKTLANLRTILYGSGHARCSSIENVGRGLPNDHETKKMRETWTAYKNAVAGLNVARRRVFEHIILRNSYREWMKFPDCDLFRTGRDKFISALTAQDNYYRDGEYGVYVNSRWAECSNLLRFIYVLSERMPREISAGRKGSTPGHTGAIGDAQANALYGGESKLDELYMAKAKRDGRSG